MGRNHLRILRTHPEFEVVGVVDPVPPLWPHLYLWFSDIRSLAPGAWDAAIVATPSVSHHVDVRNFSDIPTLVEKPLAECYADAYGMINPLHVVGHVERFNPAVRELKRRVDAGEIKDVQRITALRLGGPLPEDGRNVVYDLAVHDLDVIRWVFGRLRIVDSTSSEHAASIQLATRDGSNVLVNVDRTSAVKIRSLVVRAGHTIAALDYIEQTIATKNGRPFDPVDKIEPLRAEIDAFAHFVKTGERGDLCSAEDAAAAVLLCEQALNPRDYI